MQYNISIYTLKVEKNLYSPCGSKCTSINIRSPIILLFFHPVLMKAKVN